MNKKITQTIIIAVVACLFLAVAVVMFVMSGAKPDIDKVPDPVTDPDDDNKEGNDNSNSPDVEINRERKEGIYNILVFGKDHAGLNTDTIMLVSVDVKNNKASVVQIPRDTKLITDRNSTKVNAAFAYGVNALHKQDAKATLAQLYENGAAMLCSEVEKLLAVEIDHYVLVQLEGFKNIVDAIGGVPLTLENDLDYEDPDQDLYIHLKAGDHVLDGEHAMQFVRFRKGYRAADIARLDAQKLFMTAFMNKVLSIETVETLPKLIEELSRYVTTTMSLKDMTSFGLSAFNFSLSGVTFLTLPGEADGSYYYLYPDHVLTVVNNKLNVYDEDMTEEELNIYIPDGYSYKYKDIADVEGSTGEEIDKEGIHIPMSQVKPAPAPDQNDNPAEADSEENGDETASDEASEDGETTEE